MYQHHIFAKGVQSVLSASWTVRCETPLVIRNGLSVGYTEVGGRTGPRSRIQMEWRPPTRDTYAVAALHYGYEIVNDRVSAYHFVPASSVRGALRAWTIQHVVHPDFRDVGISPSNAEPERSAAQLVKMRRVLEDKEYGYQLIASLFGLALDTRADEDQMSNASRLRIETEKFDQAAMQVITALGTVEKEAVGPEGARRFMNVRNPLDRITHASKDGGLHHFLEFCSHQSFVVRLTILNPQATDLGLLSLWTNEMNYGLLRIGALTSIGRGRVSVIDQSYDLWRSRNASALTEIEHLMEDGGSIGDDALAGLWHHYTIPPTALPSCEAVLQSYIGRE